MQKVIQNLTYVMTNAPGINRVVASIIHDTDVHTHHQDSFHLTIDAEENKTDQCSFALCRLADVLRHDPE